MIKREELKATKTPPLLCGKEFAANVDLDQIREWVEELNEEEYGLPIEVSTDEVKSGGLFNATIEECLVFTNIQHRTDYFKYVLTMQKQGKRVIVAMWYYGVSAQTQKSEGRGSIFSLGRVNQSELDAEYYYYGTLEGLINAAVNG